MKYLFALLLPISIFFTSCGNIEEELVFEDSKKGSYTVKYDMIQGTVNMTVQMMKAFTNDSTMNEDSLRQEVTAKIWADCGGSVDSIIDPTKDLPDSLRNDPQVQRYMERSEAFMRGNEKDNQLYVGIKYPFEDTEDLNNFYAFLEKRNNAQQANPMMGSIKNADSKTTISNDGKMLKRTTIVKTPMEMDEKATAMMTMMMSGFTYRTTVITPTKIINAKGNGLVSVKGRTAVFEYNMMKVIANEEDTNFEIEIK